MVFVVFAYAKNISVENEVESKMKVLHEFQYEMRKLVYKLLFLFQIYGFKTLISVGKPRKRAPKRANIDLRREKLRQCLQEIKREPLVIAEIHGN